MNNKVKTAIGAVVVVLIVVAGVMTYKIKKNKPILVSQHPITITPDQKQRLETEISDDQKKIATTTDASDKMSLYLNIGLDYEGLGQFDQAKTAFVTATETYPQSYLPWSDLASLYQAAGDTNSEKDALTKALSLGSTDFSNWDKWIDFVQYQLKANDAQIRSTYSDGFQATNDNLDLHLKYTSYLEQIKAYADELTQWQFILGKTPTDATAISEVTRLKGMVK